MERTEQAVLNEADSIGQIDDGERRQILIVKTWVLQFGRGVGLDKCREIELLSSRLEVNEAYDSILGLTCSGQWNRMRDVEFDMLPYLI